MFYFAIVDDKADQAERLFSCIEEYFQHDQTRYHIAVFLNEVQFLENFIADYDAIFLDVEMPNFSGLEVAREIRLKDSKVCIIFVTQFAQYAVNGYEVSAFDYLIKPIVYHSFVPKMDRIMRKVQENKNNRFIFLKSEGELIKVEERDIRYVEVHDHNLLYHTVVGEYRIAKMSLKVAEEQLDRNSFMKCNDCYLVNMRHITAINGNLIYLGKESLFMSRAKKKDCMKKFADFISGGNI
jgi:DNA-binding LytR/AlgR family response regulator